MSILYERDIPIKRGYTDLNVRPWLPEIIEYAAVRLHAEEWLNSLHRYDIMSLTLLLHNFLVTRMHLSLTNAAKLIGETVKKSDRTVREWRVVFLTNSNNFPDSLQGRYQRRGVLWHNERLNKCVRQFVLENASVKGRPNMTARSFCHWVNEELLPNEPLEPCFPRRVSVETSRK